MDNQKAIALSLENIRVAMASGNELGLDTSALKRDLQALHAGGSVKKRKRAETETELTQKIRASWDHVEIVRQMNHKIMDAGVQEAGCEALWYLCFNAATKLKVSSGGMKAVVAALRGHVGAEEVQEAGCRALAKITNAERVEPLLHIFDSWGEEALSGIIETVLAGMRAHAFAPGVQEQAFLALGNLATARDTTKDKIAELGGLEALLAGMRAHADAAGVQVAGSSALCSLCDNNDNNRVKAAELFGIEVVLAGMNVHEDAEGVQLQGCRALSNLSVQNADNQAKVAALGGIKAVVACMRTHAGIPGVQAHGCRALRTLCDDASNRERIRKLHRDVVEGAMAAHPSSRAVQDEGRKLAGKLA
eukprot:CAMPEP_0180268050 /NCGR_PEP_ID=MMETSP0988-20121125/1895_1 /TAXON_ID=697907 /ORGANISM="non described non described, Strain CCMP2293" /LENGTH=362 /DNA_ID=CAMNT_0022238809 /DNA_START=15 /DNA_END=1103 /DNA_ORIENTATION=-